MRTDAVERQGCGRERLVVIAVACALVVFRAWVFVWWEQSHFDADQAIVGLMAKHLLEGRAFPLFFYGQQYLLGVESWLVAPFFLIGGVTVATLKLPLLFLSLVTVVLLIIGLERFGGMRPWLAGLASLFFILRPPSAASRLVQANGRYIEPFVYVLLMWFLRHRPIWLGGPRAGRAQSGVHRLRAGRPGRGGVGPGTALGGGSPAWPRASSGRCARSTHLGLYSTRRVG